MSFEEDIIAACRNLIARSREVVTFAGSVQSYDSTSNTVTFIVDGASAGTPCKALDNATPVVGLRGVAIKVGDAFYFLGRLGNRVVSLPDYTVSHPTNTSPGDMWLRSDLGHVFVNIAGTPTQMI